MKAITLWQPWASAIAMGLKKIETRSWSTDYRGPLAIHAAKRRVGTAERDLVALVHAEDDNNRYRAFRGEEVHHRLKPPGWLERLPYGCVVAVVDLVNVWRTETVNPTLAERRWGDYAPGRFAWIFTKVRVLEPPVPAPGARLLWDWHAPVGSGDLEIQQDLWGRR